MDVDVHMDAKRILTADINEVDAVHDEHVVSVIRGLRQGCVDFIGAAPHSSHASRVRELVD